MRSPMPAIFCDHEMGYDEWTIDDYKLCVSSTNDVQITRKHPALGWTHDGENDFCPEHVSEAQS